MGLIDDVFNETFAVAFDGDIFPGVETVVYNPYNGSPRTIKAIVSREGVKPNFSGGKSLGLGVQIWIQNDATNGVTSINGRDTVTMKVRLDKQPSVCTISKVWEDSDAGTWHLSVQGSDK